MVGAEGEAPVAQAAREELARCRADRDHGRELHPRAGHEGHEAAHARAAQRDRARRQQRRHGGDVVERVGAQGALALAVAALVEADRRHARGAQRAGHVELVLLLRAGAVDHDDAALCVAVGQEEGVGQPVAGAQLGRRLDVDGAHGAGLYAAIASRRRRRASSASRTAAGTGGSSCRRSSSARSMRRDGGVPTMRGSRPVARSSSASATAVSGGAVGIGDRVAHAGGRRVARADVEQLEGLVAQRPAQPAGLAPLHQAELDELLVDGVGGEDGGSLAPAVGGRERRLADAR